MLPARDQDSHERNVEDIAVGDLLLTAFGQSRPVQWVGRWEAQKKAGQPLSKYLRPVRIRQSALGPNTPYMDLYVSEGHAIFVDGVLVPAGQLINGTSITLHDAEEVDELEYFHVKMASHDVILAAGCTVRDASEISGRDRRKTRAVSCRCGKRDAVRADSLRRQSERDRGSCPRPRHAMAGPAEN
jgi:hypothetical protein